MFSICKSQNNNLNFENNIEYQNFSWVINSYFDYKNPRNSILNVAYPSAIAYYYITIIPPNSDINIFGNFATRQVFEISITFYKSNGDIDTNYDTYNTYKNEENIINLNVKNDELLYVIQRFYVNLDFYSTNDIINNLFYIYDNNQNKILPTCSLLDRTVNSIRITDLYRNIIKHNSLKTNRRFSKFFLPLSSGLFACNNHLYIISTPGKYKCLKIQGKFKYSKDVPYCDFITVNQNTTETDNGLPFYKFTSSENSDGNYELYVAHDDCEHLIENKSNIPVLKWKNDNYYKAVIFRIINYNYDSNIQNLGPLTPSETEAVMISGFYPDITPVF